MRDSFPTSLTLSWGQSPSHPTTARARDLPTRIHMQKNSKAEGLLDLISCCAFCKIRIIPPPSQKRKAWVRGCRGWGGGEETVAKMVGGGSVFLNTPPPSTAVFSQVGPEMLGRCLACKYPNSLAFLPSACRSVCCRWCGGGGAPAPRSRETDQCQELTLAL